MAGSALIGSLRVALGLDSAQFASGAKQAESTLAGLTGSIKAFAAGALGALSFGAVTAVLKSSVDHMDELWKTSQKIGIPVAELSKLEYAAKLSDLSLEDLTTSMKKFNVQLYELAGGGTNKAGDAMKALGVNAFDANGNLRPTTQILADIAGKFAQYKDGAEKSAIATALFSKNGIQMIPLLNGGADALREAYTEAERFGVVVDQNSAKAAENFNDNLTRLHEASTGLVNQIMVNMIPTLSSLSSQFVENIGPVKDLAEIISRELTKAIADFISVGMEGAQILRSLSTVWQTVKEDFANPFGTSDSVNRWKAAFDKIQQDADITGKKIRQMYMSFDGTASGMANIDGFVRKVDQITKPQDTENAPIIQIAKKTKTVATDAEKALAKMSDEGKRLTEEMRTPLESYSAEIAHLNELLKVGAIDHDTYDRAVQKLKDDFGDTATVAKTAGNEIGQAFSGAMLSGVDALLDGTFKLKDALGDLLKNLTKIALNNAFSALAGGSLYGGSAGVLGSIFGSLFGFARGGTILPGGNGGIDSQLVMFRKSPNERVDITKPGQTLHSGSGASNVTINNYTGAKVTHQSSDDGPIINIERAVSDAIASGSADGAFASRFGARPTPVRR